jgi:hypothetical protein
MKKCHQVLLGAYFAINHLEVPPSRYHSEFKTTSRRIFCDKPFGGTSKSVPFRIQNNLKSIQFFLNFLFYVKSSFHPRVSPLLNLHPRKKSPRHSPSPHPENLLPKSLPRISPRPPGSNSSLTLEKNRAGKLPLEETLKM